MSFQIVLNALLYIVPVALAIYFYMQSQVRIEPKLSYFNSSELRKSSTGDRNIKVLFQNKEVERVTSTHILFWNQGKKPIQQQDVACDSPLSILLTDKGENIDILDYSIEKVSRDSTRLSVYLKNNNELALGFDFIDKSDGIRIKVQHTGSIKTLVTLEGIILGPQKKIGLTNVTTKAIKFERNNSQQKTYNKSKKKKYIDTIIISIFMICALSLPLIISYTRGNEQETKRKNDREIVKEYLMDYKKNNPMDSISVFRMENYLLHLEVMKQEEKSNNAWVYILLIYGAIGVYVLLRMWISPGPPLTLLKGEIDT